MSFSLDQPFHELVLIYAKFYFMHLVLMFGWFFFLPLIVSPLLQARYYGRARDALLRSGQEGWRGTLRAILLGVVSPPGRAANVRAAEALLAKGVPLRQSITFLLASHNLGIYFFAWISANIGPQPMLGLYAATILTALCAGFVLRCTGWEKYLATRKTSAEEAALRWEASGFGGWLRRLGTDIGMLWLPVIVGFFIGVVLAVWGLRPYFFGLPEIFGLKGEGVAAQTISAFVGMVLSGVTFMVPLGNIFVGSWLWKTHFIPYAGLLTFWIGSVLHPFTLARYGHLFGSQGRWRLVVTVWISAVAASLVTLALWHALDGLLALVGIKEFLTKQVLGSPIVPSRIPWFHVWFRP